VVRDDEDGRVERRIIPPPAFPGVIGPRAFAAEHVAAHQRGSDVLQRLLDDARRRVDLAALLAVALTPGGEPEGPLVKLHATLAQRILLALIRPRDEAVQ
jgi:hypothetical protein